MISLIAAILICYVMYSIVYKWGYKAGVMHGIELCTNILDTEIKRLSQDKHTP